jgi:hypothetical protein
MDKEERYSTEVFGPYANEDLSKEVSETTHLTENRKN